MLKTSTKCLVWMLVTSSVFVNGQNCPPKDPNCPQHCINCKLNNGDLIKATCCDLFNSQIPNTTQELTLSHGTPYFLPFITTKFFEFKDDLTILRILSNHLDGLKGASFAGCPNLELLDLSDNNVQMILAVNFKGLTKLTYLSLNHNAIVHVGNSVFKNLTALEELHIAYNAITNLDEDDFKGLSRIRKINLEFNKIATIDKAFNGLIEIEEINLEGNELTRMVAGMFENLNNLRTLNLKANRIHQIDPVSLDGTSMTYLNLMQNNLTEIPTEFLQHISNISLEVTLAANNISDIAEGELHEVVLKTLTLVGNNMTYVHQDSICDSFIEKLDFQQNLLTHFPQGLEKHLNQSNTVLLSNNPWSCDCGIQWVKTLLRNNTQEPFCSQPLSYRGQPLSKIINDLNVACKANPHLPVPTKNIPIPPRQIEVTPRLRGKTTKCSTTIKPKDRKQQKSSKSSLGIILGVVFGLLFLCLFAVAAFFFYKKKQKSNVAPELKMECRKPDANCRTQLHPLPKTSQHHIWR